MRCSYCGNDNREGRKFCAGCGAALTLACAACGANNQPGERFCGGCGKPLADLAKPAPPPDPLSYTPKHLAEKILTSRTALEGERKQVTVLFADVKGLMDLAEQIDPEEWHKVMDRFFAILSDGVHRFEGTVNQYTGDGTMALFGAPIAHEDHAQRACYPALHLRDELRPYADELRIARGVSFSVRMGLNSGEVVVGKIGEDLRMDYTAQGHTVGLAARMEQLAETRSICLTEHTAKLVGGYFALRDLGESRIKGVSEPLQFRREGEYWTISYRDRLIRLKDMKGLRYIAYLLAHPSEQFHVRDLVTTIEEAAAGDAQGTDFRADGLAVVSDLGHAGEMLDSKARSELRQRVTELRAELTDADEMHDTGRAESVRTEMDFMTHQLSAAFGLGGRERKSGDHAERMRSRVGRAIRASISAVREQHPALGHHFATCIRTGYLCSYLPDPEALLTWLL